MPKRIKFNPDQFIDAYQSKNEFGNINTIKDLARIFRISICSVKKYAKQFGLSRNKRKTMTNKTCPICQYEFEVCICDGIAHG